ncbi:MAG: DNA primase [Wenzhouxiangellaceae bacterium]
MSGLIPQSFIETLLERIDIVDVIGSRVPLKPAGHEFKACCPFHDEKTPSFYVSPVKQFYHCFGCGAHGTAIGFVMAYDGLSFPDAVEELASHLGLEVPHEGGRRTDDRQRREREEILAALEAAGNFFRAALRHDREAQDYLKRRGLDAATIDEFGIGRAPDAWSALVERLTGIHAPSVLEAAGLATRTRDGRLIDRFRNRIMFPILDRRGRVIAFGGRALGEDGPKYLNSAESPVFHKGRELYRLYNVRKGGAPDRIIVVEGYMDAAALYQFGFRDTVATLGTAVTGDQVEAMFRACPVVVFCFDGDRAGRRAAWKGLEAALPLLGADRELRFLFLPEGEDPDSLVRHEGTEAFAARLDAALPMSKFFFDELGKDLDLETPDGAARLAERARPLLDRLPAGAFAELMESELARLTGLARRRSRRAAPPQRRSYAPNRPLNPVQYAVAILVQHPELAAHADPRRLEIPAEIKGVRFLAELIEYCRAKPHISTALILERWRDAPEGPFLAELATRDLAGGPDELEPALQTTLERIRRRLIQARILQLQQMQAKAGLSQELAAELRHWLSLRASERQDSG